MGIARPSFTLGVEEEFAIVDPETRELRSHIEQIIADGRSQLHERVRPELHQSVVEVGTGICKDVGEVRRDVTELRRGIIRLGHENGLRVAATGTHPFSHWADQAITDHPRYKDIVDELQTVALGNLIFGLHVHVGIEDRDLAVQIMNEARYFLPHVLALATNSPFWLGRDTGLKSYRTRVFARFPRTGIPEAFATFGEFEAFVGLLVKMGCIDSGKSIWWDVRPHTVYPTIEFRVCDVPLRADETVALAALIQAICAKLYTLRVQNLGWRPYRRALIEENKWRACRYGIDGAMLDLGKDTEVPFRDLTEELLAFVDDVLDELGSRDEIQGIRWILEHGTGADRQVAAYRAAGNDLKQLVDFICAETAHGLGVEEAVAGAAGTLS